MLFSEYYKIDAACLKKYGAIDISLVADTPLFIDPLLIFSKKNQKYKDLHSQTLKYFIFLYKKAREILTEEEILYWFGFKETPQNWLGYSFYGNKGRGSGKLFATYIYKHIDFAMKPQKIAKERHFEKIMLLEKGTGKDRISDMTVSILKKFFLEYTQVFAVENIDPSMLEHFVIDKVSFDYDTENFISEEFTLPFIQYESGKKEYVILTPSDMVRTEEPSINRKAFINSYSMLLESLDNSFLRLQVNSYISNYISQFEKNAKKPLKDSTRLMHEKKAFEEAAEQFPELYDYFIKMMENKTNDTEKESAKERELVTEFLDKNVKALISLYEKNTGIPNISYPHIQLAEEEARRKIRQFKHIIEDCDGYKTLYYKDKPIANEDLLQRIFKAVWVDSEYKVDAETNNGRGYADFVISFGKSNQAVVEFKLANNTSLSRVFHQVDIYKKANETTHGLIVIFYFSEIEKQRTEKLIEESGHKNFIDDTIFLVDCRKDNKMSASKTKSVPNFL